MQKMILLIDDDQEELHILSQALQVAELPHSCVWAMDTERAAKLLKEEILPDYIFIDYNMPKENGIACMQQIRKIENIQEVPIILYSNTINEMTRKEALSKGASFCLEKPGSFSKLVEHLIRIMGEGNLIPSLK